MKVIYLASPYRGETENEVWEHITNAHRTARKIWKLGVACISPCSNTAFFGGKDDDQLWLDGDIEILKRCDAVYMNEGWENSSGCLKEKKIAESCSIPVFTDWPSLDKFIAGIHQSFYCQDNAYVIDRPDYL